MADDKDANDYLAEALDRIYWLERELEILDLENRQLKKTRGKKMADENKEPPKEEKKDLIAAAKQLPPTEIFSLKPRTFDEAFRFANLIAESTLIPKEFQKSPANVLIAVQLGMELGVSPMQALQNIAVINGRPTIWGDLLPAIVFQSGLLEEFDEQGDEKEASCTVKRKGLKAITRTFSMAEATRAGLAERQTYKQYPKRMLQMRARAYAMRDMFADVLKGVPVREEVEYEESRDVTPEPLRTPQALAAQPSHKDGDPGVEGARQPLASTTKETKPDERKSDSPSRNRVAEKGDSSGTVSAQTTVTAEKPEIAKVRGKKEKSPAESGSPEVATGEKTQDDIIAECLLWIENAPSEQLNADDNWLMNQVKHLKGIENQLKVLRPFNNRRQELAKQ